MTLWSSRFGNCLKKIAAMIYRERGYHTTLVSAGIQPGKFPLADLDFSHDCSTLLLHFADTNRAVIQQRLARCQGDDDRGTTIQSRYGTWRILEDCLHKRFQLCHKALGITLHKEMERQISSHT